MRAARRLVYFIEIWARAGRWLLWWLLLPGHSNEKNERQEPEPRTAEFGGYRRRELSPDSSPNAKMEGDADGDARSESPASDLPVASVRRQCRRGLGIEIPEFRNCNPSLDTVLPVHSVGKCNPNFGIWDFHWVSNAAGGRICKWEFRNFTKDSEIPDSTSGPQRSLQTQDSEIPDSTSGPQRSLQTR